MDLVQRFYRQLLINFPEQRNVGLEVLIEIADVYKSSKNLWREHKLECLPVLLN